MAAQSPASPRSRFEARKQVVIAPKHDPKETESAPSRGPISIHDVAARAQVSIATVSRVLNGVKAKANKETIARVQQAAIDLDYKPAHAGRTLRLRETKLVALLIPDITNSFYSAIAQSIELALRRQNHTMILCNTCEDPNSQDAYLEEMQSYHVRGVALLGAVASPGLSRALKQGLPIAFVNRRPPSGGGIFIGIDNVAAGRAVADHFIEHGYGDCAVIRGPQQSSASRERFEGYRTRLSECGIEIKRDRILEGGLSLEGGYSAAKKLLAKQRPRAIFCGNDLMAYGANRHCRELNLAVPGDLALFGFDDNPLNEWIAPWLSTVHVPYDAFGDAVANALGSLWEKGEAVPVEHLLPFSLKLRGSAE